MRARTPPTLILPPSGTAMCASVPDSYASIGMVALSVSTSAISSPARTLSPSFLCHLTTVPSVMVSESWGMVIWAGMEKPRRCGASRRTLRIIWWAVPTLHVAHFAHGGDNFFDAGLHGQLEI